MKFFLSSLVPLAVLFTSAFALPTGSGLCARALSVSFGRLTNDVHAVDDHLSKRQACIDAMIQAMEGTSAAKRGSSSLTFSLSTGADAKRNVHEFSKRSEEYNVLVHSLPSPGTLFGRSTDSYGGRSVLVNIPENMVQDLQQMGVTQDQLPEYMSQNTHVVDPETGDVYTLAPNNGISVTAAVDIIIDLVYLPK